MGAGGIVNQRAKVLLVAVTDPSLYGSLSSETKRYVDAIDAKDPLSRTEDDIAMLLGAIQEAVNC